MKVRLLTGWNGSTKDTVLDLDEGTALLLIERAKAVREPDPESKAEAPSEDKAVKHAPANKSKPKRK